MLYLFFFFFSSRRRHTRSLCDWSSDVCSSDLAPGGVPGTGNGGGGDRDAALALLFHPVGHRGALVDLAHLVDGAGVEKNALGRRGLAGIDVRGDADVARPLERERTVLRVDRRNLRLVSDDSNDRCGGSGHGKGLDWLPAEVGE